MPAPTPATDTIYLEDPNNVAGGMLQLSNVSFIGPATSSGISAPVKSTGTPAPSELVVKAPLSPTSFMQQELNNAIAQHTVLPSLTLLVENASGSVVAEDTFNNVSVIKESTSGFSAASHGAPTVTYTLSYDSLGAGSSGGYGGIYGPGGVLTY